MQDGSAVGGSPSSGDGVCSEVRLFCFVDKPDLI